MKRIPNLPHYWIRFPRSLVRSHRCKESSAVVDSPRRGLTLPKKIPQHSHRDRKRGGKSWRISIIFSYVITVVTFGLALAHCGGSDGSDHCTTNADCAKMGANFLCNLNNNTCECLPSCAGRCCGDDGCGDTCKDNCGEGMYCDENFCRCKTNEYECTTDIYCEAMGTNFYCDQLAGICKCAPACKGKCCGDDGCGGTCDDDCPAGQTCEASSCTCEGEPICSDGDTRCMGNMVQTCDASGTWNDTTDCTMSNELCQNGQCELVGTCNNGDTRCMGDVVQTCNATGIWDDTMDCAMSNQVCQNGQCVATGTCNNGDTRCMGDVVQTCDATGTWKDTTNCANEEKTCSLGTCVARGLCPGGQDCIDVTGTGYLGCTDGGYIPAGQTTGCNENTRCPANETCMNTNDGTVCIANCGTCATDLLCMEVGSDGTMGCLDLNGFIPADAPGDCAQNGCSGNATCWCMDQDCTDTACIANCTVDGPCTEGSRCDNTMIVTCLEDQWTPVQDCSTSGQVCFQGACASNGLCPQGQTCDVLAGETTGCLEGGGTVPAENQTGCGQDSPCNGNFTCWCTDQNCATTICIENCGICTEPLLCKDITVGDGTGTFACTETDGSIPASAQTACQTSADCNGNAGCWCLNADCTDTVCLFNCSTPH